MPRSLTTVRHIGTFNLSQYLPEKFADASGRLFLLGAVSIILSLLLGGGTRSGFLSDALLQLLTIPLLIVALSRLFDLRSHDIALSSPLIWALAFCGAIVVVPLVQLVPLPPSIWTHLPGRKPEIEAFELMGRNAPWMPISVSPDLTWQSAMSLIPPSAVFIGTVLLGYRRRRLLSLVVLGFGLVSVLVGLLQVAQGETSPLRFFQFTNPSEAVGFFANRNHFAALLYVLTLFAAAWAIQAASTAKSWWGQKNYHAASIVPIVASFTVLVVLVTAQAMARSRAGLALTMIALFGTFALAYVDRRRESRGTARKLIAVTVTLAVIFSVQFALYRVMERFDADPLQDTRIPIARNTLAGAAAFLPFGAGMGTFVPVYGIYEKPKDALINTYVNHAHDDVLEVLLEAGLLGVVLMGFFVAGWGYHSAKIWRREARDMEEIDLALARAASIVVGLVMLHSLVEYPLRTGSMMAILAFAGALLIDPPVSDTPENNRRKKVMAAEASVAAGTALSISQPRSFQAPQTIDWPDEWRDPESAATSRSPASASDKPVLP
jgi:O-antigen ligase